MRLNLPISVLPRPSSPPDETFNRKPLPPPSVDLRSAEGRTRFRSALARGDAELFYHLFGQYQTQAHPAFCGLTSLCVVLNALEIDPRRVWFAPWRWFAEPMLRCCFDLRRVKAAGVTLDELARAGRAHGAHVSVYRGVSLDKARRLVRGCVRGRENGVSEYLIASYDRDALGQTGTGHFSPLAAYDERTDSVLILDVARFKYGPHWVSLKDLVHATSLPDPDVGIARGLLVVGRETQETGECHNKPEYQDVCVRTGSLACGRTRGMVLLIASVVVVGLVAAGCYLYR